MVTKVTATVEENQDIKVLNAELRTHLKHKKDVVKILKMKLVA